MHNLFKSIAFNALICLCVLKIVCALKEELSIEKRLLNLQQIKTGYPVEEENDLSDVTEDVLTSITLRKYHDIKCGYLFHAQLHMEMTSNFLFTMHRQQLNVELTSYENEALIMINTLSQLEGIKFSALCLVFMYAHKIRSYLNELANAGTSIDKEVKILNLDMHNYVIGYLKEYTSNHCRLDNVYNMRWDHCEVIEEYRMVKKSNNSLVKIMDIIKKNKKAFYDIVKHNDDYGVKINNKNEIDYNYLYIFDLVTKDRLMNNFLFVFSGITEWGNTVQRLKNALVNAKYTGLMGILNIGKYQHMFVNFLKAIMLRITCKHLLYMNQLEKETKELKLNFMKIYEICLKGFVDFVCLNEDSFFNNLLAYYASEERLDKNIRNTVIENLNNELGSILTELGCNTESPIILDDMTSSSSFERIKKFNINIINVSSLTEKTRKYPIEDAFFSVRAYIAYLWYIFNDNQLFKVVNSVMEMTDYINSELEDRKYIHILQSENYSFDS